MLPNGRVLLFNNGTEQSTVLEVDPRTDKIEWQYTAPGFFSEKRGSNQRLANGNTLITESDRGRVFEVTPEGEVVWEFVNPATTDDGKREALWRMVRLDPENLAFLDSR
jgi:outer membrane protein assembly factor BamB